MKKQTKLAKVLIAPAAMLCATSAFAQGDEPANDPPLEITGNIGGVSDYRFRGISLSDRDPAIQGGVDAVWRDGWFVGAWASNVADTGGTNAELDLYGGYAGTVAGLDYSVGAFAFLYPGGKDVNYGEVKATLSKTIGPATLGTEIAYAPDQKNTATDNLYIGGNFAMPIGETPLQIKLRGGHEDGFFEQKWDWEAGLAYEQNWGRGTLSIVGTDYADPAEAGRLGETSVVAGFSILF